MEFRVLGPLEVRVRDRPLPLGGTRPRAVLAALLLARNTVVPVDRLVTAIWAEDPPGTPTAQIQAAVSALRKTLGADRVVTRSPGYLIRIERGELDLDEFDREVSAARRKQEEGDLDGAADGLRAALQWWRDDALVDLAELPVRTAAVALEDRRWAAREERIEADLALRRHADLVPELRDLVAAQPLRDRLWTQLMRALYRCGRRAEALETYQRARQVMRDELGLEPAAELVAVHDAILADDPALDPDVLPLGHRPEWVRPPCPFRALTAYQPGDAETFHGRRVEISALALRVHAGPVTVVGPSGAGKSSLVLAGVLPALAGCTALVVRPSDHGRVDLAVAAEVKRLLAPTDPPLEITAVAGQIVDGGMGDIVDDVLAHAGGERLVVVLDQAEELLTQDASVVDPVVTALFDPALADRVTVLATLRADFLGAVLERTALSTTLGREVFTLGALGPEQLRESITGPLALLPGVTFQPGLVDRLIGDVGSEPGALALLGVTLTLLWDEQVEGALTHEAYDDLGRVPGALAAHAEGEWRRRNLADDEPAVRRLVGHLVRVDRDGRVTRRLASYDELDEQGRLLALRLSSTRLAVMTGDIERGRTVELAHDALTTHWPRLNSWIEGDTEFHVWRTALRGDLERWREFDRDPALLVRGAALAAAHLWCTDHEGRLGADEIEFIRLSHRAQHQTGRRSMALRAVLAGAAVLVLLLGLVFVQQRSRTASATAEAESRAFAAESVAAADRDPSSAALMAVAAYDRAPTQEARDALFARYRDVGRLDDLHAAQGVEPGAAQTSSDGGVVAAALSDGTGFAVWLRRDGHTDRLELHSWDGANIQVAEDGGAVWLLDRDGIARLDVASGVTRTVVAAVWSGVPQLALSPDGSRILLKDDAGPAGYRVREWSVADGRERGSTIVPKPVDGHAAVRAGATPGTAVLEFTTSSPDTYRAEVLDVSTGGRAVVAIGASGSTAVDGSAVVTCTVAGGAAVLTGTRVADRAPAGRVVLPNAGSTCPPFVVGPGGRVIVKEDLGGVRVVNLGSGAEATLNAFAAGSGLAGSFPAMVTADGSRLLTTGPWGVALSRLDGPTAVTPGLRHADVLDDGRALVGVSGDGRTLVVDPLVDGGPAAATPRPSPWQPADTGVPALAVGASGVLADRIDEHRVALHRLPGLEPLSTVTLPAGRLGAMYVDSADLLVTVVDQQVLWWDTRTGSLRHRLDLASPGDTPTTDTAGSTVAVAPTPDPNLIAVSDRDRPDVTLRDVGDGHVVDTLPVGRDVDRVSFQRSSAYVLVSRPNATEVWDGHTRQRVLGPLAVGDGAARVAAMLRDPGRFLTLDLVAGHWRLRTYEVGTAGPLASVDLGPLVPAALSADGKVVMLGSDDGTAADVLRLDPADWRRDVCAALVGADLADDDRAAHPDIFAGQGCAAPRP